MTDDQAGEIIARLQKIEDGMARMQDDMARMQNVMAHMQNGMTHMREGMAHMQNGMTHMREGMAHMKDVDARIERMETRLLTAFHEWASPVVQRGRSHGEALRLLDLEFDELRKRVEKLEARSA